MSPSADPPGTFAELDRGILPKRFELHCHRLLGNAKVELPLAELWNGSKLTPVPIADPPNSSSLEMLSVSCPSSSTCLAVGYDEDSIGLMHALAERWNGSRFSITPGSQGTASSGNADATSFAAALLDPIQLPRHRRVAKLPAQRLGQRAARQVFFARRTMGRDEAFRRPTASFRRLY